SGLSVRAISNLERARTRWPYPNTLSRLADALQLDDEARQMLLTAAGRRLARTFTPAPEDKLPPDAGGLVVPQQLPGSLRHFIGRKNELAALTELRGNPGAAGAAMVISAIGGTPGVGKTALALHWAHQVAGQFGGGQLYANLRGFDPSTRPVESADVLHAFLIALGAEPERIPADSESRAGLYRSLMAGKRVLVLLDNASDPAQVRPLLPGAPGCLVVVTSRSQLASLVALEGAQALVLDVLPAAEARELLAARLGAELVIADPAAIDELVELCAGLPLALSIAAAHVSSGPRPQLGGLVAELRDAQQRLDALSRGDAAANLRAVFSCSYQALSGEAARMFRLLGLHPAASVGVAAAASLAAASGDVTRRALRELSAAYLLTEEAPGHYSLHDLLRVYAAELAGTDAELGPATHRILDHYLHTARAAGLLLFPAHDPVSAMAPQPGTVLEDLASDRQALAWFDTERPALLAATALAAQTRFDSHAWQIPATLAVYLERRGHWHDYAAAQATALAAAEDAGDLAGQATARCLLGRAYGRIGSHGAAHAHLERALELYRTLGDQAGQAHTHHSLGWVLGERSRYRDALHHAREALALYQAAGHRTGQARALNTVGWYGSLLGQHQEALIYCRQALDLHRKLGNHDGEADAWDSLGHAHFHLGHYTDAVACYLEALSLFRQLGDRHLQADILARLGEAYLAAGERATARDTWTHALAIFDDLRRDARSLRVKLDALEGSSDLADRP
ncbi:MAG: tetratricopeptide repeat protein, partial [Actinomycetota bacterium]|nr:tetratricopeptide repeat protein [Actinomycetota bacterium]